MIKANFIKSIIMKRCSKSIAIYLGSRSGNGTEFLELASELGRELANRDITIVYGGANVGTMGALADGALAAGGEVIGVFPVGFKGKRENSERNIEVMHKNLTKIIEVENMSQRKVKMEELSDAAIILPGSFGTLDELFEYAVNLQLGFHHKPIYVLNHNGFYNPIIELINNMVDNGFLSHSDKNLLSFYPNISELLKKI